MLCFFFFSSRRRHTRFSRDWSSDVCSSDLDKDPEAIRVAEELATNDGRFSWYHGSFAELSDALDSRQWPVVNGVLMDLGVSSPQLDDAARGFSFMKDGPLDMRMNPKQAPSAAQGLARAEEKDIAEVIICY